MANSGGKMMSGFKAPNNRVARTAEKIHQLLSEALSRGIIGRSSALDDGRAISISRVVVTTDLQHAKVYWEPMRDGAPVDKLGAALERKRGFLCAYINSYLRQRMGAKLKFMLNEDVMSQTQLGHLPKKIRESIVRQSVAAQRLDDAMARMRLTDERQAAHQKMVAASGPSEVAAPEGSSLPGGGGSSGAGPWAG